MEHGQVEVVVDPQTVPLPAAGATGAADGVGEQRQEQAQQNVGIGAGQPRGQVVGHPQRQCSKAPVREGQC